MKDKGTVKLKAALFDLDGVIFDTEPQYTNFWHSQCQLYRPDIPGLENVIKGQTLVQIYDKYFGAVREQQPIITHRLNEFEQTMKFPFIDGVEAFIMDLRAHGMKTAVVTSSNVVKMNNVYEQHPDFKNLFDRILTSEDFSASKPDPDPYLKGAESVGVEPEECVGFEDSFNGLKSVKAAREFTIGLSTTNTAESIREYSDIVVENYINIDYQWLIDKIH
jgi:HAD superfamily hydrolase (TIGR01509 family)